MNSLDRSKYFKLLKGLLTVWFDLKMDCRGKKGGIEKTYLAVTFLVALYSSSSSFPRVSFS